MSPVDGSYVRLVNDMDETDDMGHFVTDLTAALKFSLNILNQLTSIDGTQDGGGQVETANVSPVNEGPFLLFNAAAQNDADRVYSTCSFVLGSLTCVAGDNTIFYTCAGTTSAGVQVGAHGSVPDGCYQLTLNVLGVTASYLSHQHQQWIAWYHRLPDR